MEMERFTITFDKVFRSGKFILPMMEDKKMPHVVNIRNIPYLIVPDAVKFFNYKKLIPAPIEAPESSVISIDDFNNHRIVPAQEARINIFTNGRYITVIDLYTGSNIMGSFSEQYIKGIEYNYNSLLDTLPFDLFDLNDESTQTTGKFVISWSNTLIQTSTLILTLIYTLFNLDERIKITSNSDDPSVAVGYVKALTDKITTIADNFLEAIENLNFLSVLTNNGRR